MNDAPTNPISRRSSRSPRGPPQEAQGRRLGDPRQAVGMGSTEAVSKVNGCSRPRRPACRHARPAGLGHAADRARRGDQDRALRDGRRKVYRFTVPGARRPTPTTSKGAVRQHDMRRTAADIRALLPRYTGVILQMPPQFSAIKIGGERAYDLARDGEDVEIAPRRSRSTGSTRRDARRRTHGLRDRVRQGHLCALAGARHRPRRSAASATSRRCAASRSSPSRRGQHRHRRRPRRPGIGAGGALAGMPAGRSAPPRATASVAISASRGPAQAGHPVIMRGRDAPAGPASSAPPRAACWWPSATIEPACSSRSACSLRPEPRCAVERCERCRMRDGDGRASLGEPAQPAACHDWACRHRTGSRAVLCMSGPAQGFPPVAFHRPALDDIPARRPRSTDFH